MTAAPEVGCRTVQLTDITYDAGEWIDQPILSVDGSRVVITSNADLGGTNPDGDVAVFGIDVATRSVERLTDEPTSPYLSFSADLTTAAFVSGGDHTGGNADGNTEVFVLDLESGEVTQITDTEGGDIPSHGGWLLAHDQPLLTGDGRAVFFLSNREHDPGGAGEGYYWRADRDTGTISRVSGTPGMPTPGRYGVDVDDSGSRVVFESGREVYLLDVVAGTTVGLTSGWPRVGAAAAPRLSSDGGTVTFRSNGDPGGRNPDGVDQLFAGDVGAGTATQLLPAGGRNGESAWPDTAGDRIVLTSTTQYFGEVGRRMVYLFDRPTSTLVPVPGSDDDFFPSIDGEGDRVVYQSPADLTGANPDGDVELYLFDCRGRALPDYRRPDLLLRGPGQRAFIGHDVYDRLAHEPTRRDPVRRATTVRFVVRVQNDGSATDSFLMRGGAEPSGLRVRYLDGGTDVTAAMRSGGHETGPLDRGEFHKLVVEVRVRRGADLGTRQIPVEAVSATGAGGPDRVVEQLRIVA